MQAASQRRDLILPRVSKLLKPLFFWMTPERAHYAAMDLFVLASRIPGVSWFLRRKVRQQNEGQEVEVAGLKFPKQGGFGRGVRQRREVA